jgi:hypothetical protein
MQIIAWFAVALRALAAGFLAPAVRRHLAASFSAPGRYARPQRDLRACAVDLVGRNDGLETGRV